MDERNTRFNVSKVLGLNKHHNNGWIFIETLGRIQERKNKKTTINDRQARTEKVKPQTKYTEANKQVKRSIRADKEKYDSRKAPRGGNMRQICDTVKKLTEKYSKSEGSVKDKGGKTITVIQILRNRWVKHFGGLLNRPAQLNALDIEATHTDLPIDVTPPTSEEIRIADRQIKIGKLLYL
ncbi:unnamed protein product, partial [Schistosoma mattheei]